jgi:UDP-N-acetylglucosamine--N-acetylmuramyl-(pentapeptide) pyrophosphoryl-undecaprenol N-acetylglucosamine transferase
MKKIIFVGGGTLGHIYPMIPVVKKLKDKYDLYFIGTKKGLEKDLIEKLKYFKDTYYLNMQGFRRSFSISGVKYNLKTIKMYLACSKVSREILENIKPDLVVGMGGYISGVVLKAAHKLKIKTAIHEQNSVMGLSNRLMEKKVNIILLSFPLAKRIKNKNVKIVGNPRLSEIYENNRIKTEEKKLIVIVGGSRGSQFINDTVLDSLDEFKRLNYRLVLITGSKYFKENINKIKSKQDKNIRIIDFTDQLIDYIKKASVVVSRSGATTLVELMALRKVTLLIPSPNVTNNHQEKNADILVNNNCSIKLLEKDLNKKSLIENIKKLESDNELRTTFITNMSKISNYKATEDFILELEKLL